MPRPKRKRVRVPSVIDKDGLGQEINRIIRGRDLTQTEAARLAKSAPSQLSLISTGKLTGFSSERLIAILTKLGRDVEIRISRAKSGTGKVRLKTV